MRRLLVGVVLLLSAAMVLAQTGEKKAMPAAPKAKTAMVGEISVKTIPAMTAVTVMEKATDHAPKDGYKTGMEGAEQAWKVMMPDAYGKLGAWMAAGGKPTGPSFGIYFEDPTKVAAKDLTCKVGFPTTKDAKVTDAVKLEEFPEMQAAVVQFAGPYEGSMDVYGALMKWIPEHGYQFAGPPMEIYLKSEHDKVKPEEYLTEVRFPVTKADAPAPKSDKTKVGEAPMAPDAPKAAEAPKTPETPKAAAAPKAAEAPKATGGNK
ncbi:MAG TPA: GyrI-like domain-containing protein [bacterium]|jgi:effector-binding domain-containing protein